MFEIVEEIFKASLEIQRDIKERKTYKPKWYSYTNNWSMNKEIAQSSLGWDKKKNYKSNNKNPVEQTTPKYPPMINNSIDDRSQRENLFYSKCLIKKNMCSLIIDSISCDNVESLLYLSS